MEIKHFSLHDVKADEAARTIEGWASTFGNADSDNDIIARGAFADSIKAKMPKMLWQHRTDQVIGVWNEAKETEQGLYVKGNILLSFPRHHQHQAARSSRRSVAARISGSVSPGRRTAWSCSARSSRRHARRLS